VFISGVFLLLQPRTPRAARTRSPVIIVRPGAKTRSAGSSRGHRVQPDQDPPPGQAQTPASGRTGAGTKAPAVPVRPRGS
jgi:hypothetical protein